jgi:hypothetical protein
MLDTTNLKPHLPYHVVFQIVVAYTMKTLLITFFARWFLRENQHA